LSLVSSILTLTFIAWDRFFGIVFAMKAHFIERRASLTIVILWLLSIGVASPLLVYREYFEVQWRDYTESWCDDEWPIVRYLDTATNTSVVDIPARRYYYVFVCVVLFFLPCLVMSLAYALIICTLWSSQVPGERTSKDIKLQTKLRKKGQITVRAVPARSTGNSQSRLVSLFRGMPSSLVLLDDGFVHVVLDTFEGR
ncbi:hypothetical protein BaRGS_00032899, partial [Batillaria attramentaria]